MRVLFATGSPAGYMMPPRLGEQQVNCGPDWADEIGPDGGVRSLSTPAGDYDLAKVAAKLPAGQEPDVVACLVDSSRRSMPRNLAAFRCPRVLIVADTHHLSSPLIGILGYIAGEAFDRVVVTYDRHHASFFIGAGLRNLYWFPGLTFPHGDAAVQKARRGAGRKGQIAFVGQAGRHHPRRMRLLEALKERGLPLAQKALPQAAALEFYGTSLIGLNASLNGDLNLRVFEVLAAGGALLTDRLAPESGLGRLLTEGRELAGYASARELSERASHLLTHPGEARVIGSAGAKWFDENMNEDRRRTAFQALACDGTAVPQFEFSAAEKKRVLFGGDTDRLLQGVIVYEKLQELHRIQESVRVTLDRDVPEDFAAMCSTLPRMDVSRAGGACDLAVFGRARLASPPTAEAPSVWCWDAQGTDYGSLADKLAGLGFAPKSRDVALFGRAPGAAPVQSVAASAADVAAKGRVLFQKGDLAGALAHARAAIGKDGRCASALVLAGELSLRSNGGPLAERLFRQALDCQPGDVGTEMLLAEALRAQKKTGPASECIARVLAAQPHNLRALLALAALCLSDGQASAAEAALRGALKHHPGSAHAAQELGNLLKRRRRVLEALGWHRRALGYTDEVGTMRVGGRRRALFVVQHPSTWTSMASIIDAFRGDGQWETTVVALPYNHPYFPDTADRDAIFGFLESEGVAFVRWDRFALEPGCADVLFLQNPYDVTRPAGWRAPELLRVAHRLAYAPYAIEIGGTLEDATNQFNMPLQNLAWAVFARSERHRVLFARHGSVGNAHVIATGHPKFDLLCNLHTRAPDPGIAAFSRGRPVVLWNPHFDIRPDGSGYSTFFTWWKFLPEEFARRQDLALVIRPHPLLFTALESRRLATREDIGDFLRRCQAAGNILIDRNPTYLAAFAAADALISDGASFLIEYGVSGKPVGYLHNPRGPFGHMHYEVDFDFVRKHCVWVERKDELCRFLDCVRRAKAPVLAERAAAAQRQLSVNAGGAGAAIKRAVDARLDAEARSAAPLEEASGLVEASSCRAA